MKSESKGSRTVRAPSGVVRREQEPGELQRRLELGGIEVESASQRGFVVGIGEAVGFGRREAVEERLDLGRRNGAGELRGDLTVLEGLDGGDSLYTELRSERLVGVDVDLGQVDLAAALAGLGLERRAELTAGAAPLGPEVDDDRHLVGAVEHVPLEGGLADFVNHGREA